MANPEVVGLHAERRESGIWQRVAAAAAVVTVVLGWRLVVYAKAQHLQRIGRELVGVNMLVKRPVPNHAGNQLLYAQSTERGIAAYVLNVASGRRQAVYEVAEGRILRGSVQLLEWAPDDMILAYAKPIKGRKQQVVLCSSSILQKVGALEVAGQIKEFRWLSPGAFAYLNDTNTVYVVRRSSDGKWVQRPEYKAAARTPVTQIAAVSATVLAWKQGGAVWTLDLVTGKAGPLWKPESGRLLSCSFSDEKGQFILSTKLGSGNYQILALDPLTRAVYPLDVIARPDISKVGWVDGGKGFAFVSTDQWVSSLCLWRRDLGEQATLFAEGGVIDFRARRDKIFILGSERHEPPGIWEYNIGTGAMRCLVPPMEKPFSFAKTINHRSGALTNASRVVTYELWGPARTAPGKRLPLIVGQTPYAWTPYPYVAAAAGWQFVTVNRKSWVDGIDRWEEDVLAVLAEFAHRREVDSSRVYLYGHSAETIPISSLTASRPELWKGVMILSPTGLPELSQSRLSSMLIDAAELDRGQEARLSAYQAEAAKAGVVVKLVIHPKALHTSWSRSTEQAKVRELAAFLSAQ
jgi:hypothetical protein